MKYVILTLALLSFFIISCETNQPQTEPQTVTAAEPVNNTNSTNETEIIDLIEIKDVVVFQPRKNNLTLYFLDINGSSVIGQYKDKSFLIDSGFKEDSEKILKSIRDLGIDKLDYAFATNTQPKNIGGMPYIILRTEPNYLVEGIPTHLNKTVKINNLIRLKTDETFSIGDVLINILIVYDD